jgi:hypothetical protein
MNMGKPAYSDEQALAQLRTEFAGYRIFRAMRWDGKPGDWVAALRDPSAGVDLTVIRSSPDTLRAALLAEREAAADRLRAGGPVAPREASPSSAWTVPRASASAPVPPERGISWA